MTHEYSKFWSRSWRISQEVSRSLKLNATEFTNSENRKLQMQQKSLEVRNLVIIGHRWLIADETAFLLRILLKWLLCVNTVYPDGIRFYDFQILSSGFLVKFFREPLHVPIWPPYICFHSISSSSPKSWSWTEIWDRTENDQV